MTSPMSRVLILDDDETTLGLLRIAFGKMPFETVLVDRGIDALVAIFEAYRDDRPFDILVLDCALPRIDGFTVAKMVRLLETTDITFRRAKIGFFSAFSETVEQSTLLAEVGAEAYWRKPEDVTDLPYLVASWLKIEIAKGTLSPPAPMS